MGRRPCGASTSPCGAVAWGTASARCSDTPSTACRRPWARCLPFADTGRRGAAHRRGGTVPEPSPGAHGRPGDGRSAVPPAAVRVPASPVQRQPRGGGQQPPVRRGADPPCVVRVPRRRGGAVPHLGGPGPRHGAHPLPAGRRDTRPSTPPPPAPGTAGDLRHRRGSRPGGGWGAPSSPARVVATELCPVLCTLAGDVDLDLSHATGPRDRRRPEPLLRRWLSPTLRQMQGPGRRVLLDDSTLHWLGDGACGPLDCMNVDRTDTPCPVSAVRAYTPCLRSHAPYFVLHPQWRVGDTVSHKRKRDD